MPTLLINKVDKVAKKTTFLLQMHNFWTRYQVLTQVFFPYVTCNHVTILQLECEMLLLNSFDITDPKTQKVGCGDAQTEGGLGDFNVIFVCLLFESRDSLHSRLNSHYKGWNYKRKKYKKIKAYRKSIYKEPTGKKCLIILDLNQFRSWAKGKHSIGK